MKLGILVNYLGELTEENQNIIKEMNNFVGNSENDGIVFFQAPSIPCAPIKFSVMQLIEAYSFDGVVIAPTFSLAQKLVVFPGPQRKIYYVSSLEWMKMKNPPHHELASVYRSPNLEIITNSKENARKLSSCWNIPEPPVVEQFNLDEIMKVCLCQS